MVTNSKAFKGLEWISIVSWMPGNVHLTLLVIFLTYHFARNMFQKKNMIKVLNDVWMFIDIAKNLWNRSDPLRLQELQVDFTIQVHLIKYVSNSENVLSAAKCFTVHQSKDFIS